jgi:hypothetical protein
MTLSAEQLDQVKDADVTTEDGHAVGPVEGIYLDESTRGPEWALVDTLGRQAEHLRAAAGGDLRAVNPPRPLQP